MSVDRPENVHGGATGGSYGGQSFRGTEEGIEDVRKKGSEVATQARERLSRIYEEVKERAGLQGKSMQDIRENVREYIRESPGRALLYALGVGFFLGIITRR